MRVLIVEDEVLIAMAAEMTIACAGHDVVGMATREDEAVDLALSLRPDLMVVDLRLADGTSGERVAARVRGEYDVAVVFASGNLDPAMRARLQRFDPVAMLSKPYAETELMRAINAAA